MAQDRRQLRYQYFIASAFEPVLQITIMLIGLIGWALDPTIEAKSVVTQSIKALFPVSLQGLAMSGMLAVVMSTADAYLNPSGLVLAHEVIRHICDKPKLTIDELRWVHYSSFLIETFSIFNCS